ncbi:TPA: hypothetical protein QHR04_003010 [Enterobacter kobei]|nr:hypothetical protein [Enterobacter kobei]
MNNKELVKSGHELAKAISSDTPLIEIAKMVSTLATQLDAQMARSSALAAENAGLNEKMNKLATWPDIEFYASAWEFNNCDGHAALELLCDNKTPATDAFLAEVRAQGADECVRQLVISDDDDFSDAPNICAMVAHQLRKGVQS